MQQVRSFITDERNLLGICAALGHDFGFNPLFLRLILGVSLLWNPEAVIIAYACAGVFVLVSHLLFPGSRGKQQRQVTA
ncbi:PspC domain-containing protein [Aquisediminimonas profunda]|uniref:PspC domain-containing protein n=1 Tax=Aquisediminimonas profunda TaxID=1550733 RepID=UPI001C63AE89|nr:PspC domain-containing protein [Aquisediminimonas profunda]